jgi:hypothetical protein
MLPQVFAGRGDISVFRRSGVNPYRIRMVGRKQYLSVHSMLFLLVPSLELLDPAGRIHQLLLASIERMAVGADIYGSAINSGAGIVGGAAGTGKGGLFVFGVQLFFHQYCSLVSIYLKEQGNLTQKPIFSKP